MRQILNRNPQPKDQIMPTWTQCLIAMVMLAITGFSLVIVSGYWHFFALLLAFVALILWLCRKPAR